MKTHYLMILGQYDNSGYCGNDYKIFDNIHSMASFCRLLVEETTEFNPQIVNPDIVSFSEIDYETACEIKLTDIEKIYIIGEPSDSDSDITDDFIDYMNSIFAMIRFKKKYGV